jgi:hypothetical protein
MSNWTDDLVLGTSNASSGDDELRSLMTQLASGISASFFWPGSGGGSLASAGESKLGNARCAHTGNITGGYANGYLSLNSAHGSLHHLGGSGMLLGHSSMEDYGPTAVLPPSKTIWLTSASFFTLGSAVDGNFGVKNTSLGTTYPIGASFFLFLTVQQAQPGGYLVGSSFFGGPLDTTITQFSSSYSALTAAPSIATVFWESIGSVSI